MRIAVLGRTGMLLGAAKMLVEAGFCVPYIATAKASDFYVIGEKDYERFAHSIGAQFHYGARLDDADTLASIRAANCEIGISMNWPTIMSATARSCFRQGVFNAHPGELPRYRGNACPNWAILHGERRIAVCIHLMEEELDAGPVAIRKYLNLSDSDDIGVIYDWLDRVVPAAFLELARLANDGTLTLTEQSRDPSDALRCYPRRPEDSRIDWRQDSERIHRLIKASSRPMLGAFTYLEGKRIVRIWKAQRWTSLVPFLGVSGQIAGQIEGDPLVITGDAMLRLTEVEIDDGPSRIDAKKTILSSLRNRLV
jgi:methionyl-tRNA formyltransferase